MAEPLVDDPRQDRLRAVVGLMTEKDLMDLLGVTHHSTQAWRLSGNGPNFVKLGKRVYYRVNDVREWVDNNVRSSTRPDEEEAA